MVVIWIKTSFSVIQKYRRLINNPTGIKILFNLIFKIWHNFGIGNKHNLRDIGKSIPQTIIFVFVIDIVVGFVEALSVYIVKLSKFILF